MVLISIRLFCIYSSTRWCHRKAWKSCLFKDLPVHLAPHFIVVLKIKFGFSRYFFLISHHFICTKEDSTAFLGAQYLEQHLSCINMYLFFPSSTCGTLKLLLDQVVVFSVHLNSHPVEKESCSLKGKDLCSCFLPDGSSCESRCFFTIFECLSFIGL